MTTINNIEDLIRVLDENPQWVEALRVRLLTRELIELPEKFAQFAAATNQRFDRLEAEVKEIRGDVKGIQSDVQQIQGDVKELQIGAKQTQADVQQLQRDVKGMRDDLGPIKGVHARNAALNEAYFIAMKFGFTFVRTLRSEDLMPFIRGNKASGIPFNQLESFHRADLIMEAQDREGRDCYLAVEVSYTVDERDTGRAVRNAEFLTRFTGRPAYAVAAGLRYDQRVRSNIESGEALWYEMDSEALEAC